MKSGRGDVEETFEGKIVKEGFLVKRSRYLKEWKERWIVLTTTHLYSFTNKGVYKNPTESIPVKNIETLKTYYKEQYDYPHTFRVESEEANFHMFAKSAQDKWSWMSAIETVTNGTSWPDRKSTRLSNLSTTARNTTDLIFVQNSIKNIKGQEQNFNRVSGIQQDKNINCFQLRQEKVEETKIFQNKREKDAEAKASNESNHVKNNELELGEKVRKEKTRIQKEKELQINTKVWEIIIEENFLPEEMKIEIKEEKGVQTEIGQKKEGSQGQNEEGYEKLMLDKSFQTNIIPEIRETKVPWQLQKFVTKALQNEEYPKPLVDFMIWVWRSKMSEGEMIMKICMSNRLSLQILLHLLNEESNPDKFIEYLNFIGCLLTMSKQSFYCSDVRALIDILLRILENDCSELIRLCILSNILIIKTKMQEDLGYNRMQDLKQIVESIKEEGSAAAQKLAEQLLLII